MARPTALLCAALLLSLPTACSGGTDRSLGEPAADDTPSSTDAPPGRSVTWEAVLHAGSATVTDADDPALDAAQVLELAVVDDNVEVFSDRPTRLAGEMPLEELLALWHGGGFGSDPPNAAVMIDGQTTAVELERAVYDPATQRIAFAVEQLDRVDGQPGDVLPVGTAGATTLFIDAIGGVPGEISDPVTQPNVKVLGDAPAQAMGNLYQTMARSTGVAYQNAQATQSLYAQPTTTDQNVSLLYSVDTEPCPPGCDTYDVNPDD